MSATGRSLSAETGHLRHADDFYATPAWCTRAILPHLTLGNVLDPCAGEGAILNVIEQEWPSVYRYGIEIDPGRAAVSGSLRGDALIEPWGPTDLVVTNPPYALAMEFVQRAIALGVEAAFLLRINWLASAKRDSFHKAHPSDLYVLPRRPSFTRDGKTDATEYAWFVWGPGRGGRWSILDVQAR